jgi:DNA-binding XRE family transcriptional regulator
MTNKPIPPVGCEWEELKKEIFSPEEIAAGDLRVAIISELIKARNESGLTQKELETASGVKQPVIARMERGTTDPQLSTVMRVLAPLGKTLAVVPLEQKTQR